MGAMQHSSACAFQLLLLCGMLASTFTLLRWLMFLTSSLRSSAFLPWSLQAFNSAVILDNALQWMHIFHASTKTILQSIMPCWKAALSSTKCWQHKILFAVGTASIQCVCALSMQSVCALSIQSVCAAMPSEASSLEDVIMPDHALA